MFRGKGGVRWRKWKTDCGKLAKNLAVADLSWEGKVRAWGELGGNSLRRAKEWIQI